jgi:hypothetical protein
MPSDFSRGHNQTDAGWPCRSGQARLLLVRLSIKTIGFSLALAAGFGAAGWGQIILPPALPLPTTNTLPIILQLNDNHSITNRTPPAPVIDLAPLVQAMAGTDAATRNKAARAIQAIQDGQTDAAVRRLGEIEREIRLSPGQAQAVRAALDQLRKPRRPQHSSW